VIVVDLTECECLLCGHVWFSIDDPCPDDCPKCHGEVADDNFERDVGCREKLQSREVQ
jgi:hypothetical protein